AVLETEAGAAQTAKAPEPPKTEAPPPKAAAPEAPKPQAPPKAVLPPPAAAAADETAFVSPVVRKIAAEHGIDPARVPGTGSGGPATKKDNPHFAPGGAAPAPAR